MEEKVIGILKNVSELIVATLVEETDTTVKVKNPAFLGISGQNNQININFIPLEMLSLQPSVNVRNLLANPTEELVYTFDKNSVLKSDLILAQNVIDNYNNLTSGKSSAQPQTPATNKSAEENIVKLF
jgi:hypothetical protein